MLCVYINGKISVVFNRNCFSENERLFKVSPLPLQAVTYTVKVVGLFSKKWCKRDTLLLYTPLVGSISIHAISSDLE